MRNGISPIIIDNTNLHAWEMKPYAVMVGRSIILNFQFWTFCEKVKTFVLSSFFGLNDFIFITSRDQVKRFYFSISLLFSG